jgi:hypothetical protein
MHNNIVSSNVASATQPQVPPALKPLLKVALDVHLLCYVAACNRDAPPPFAAALG